MDVINDVPQTKIVEDSDIANLKGSATRPFYVWLKSVFLICFSIQQSGPSSQRPIKSLWIGRRYFDTDLNGPVYLASINPNVWVTAVGTPDKPPTLIAGDNIVIQNNAADNTQLISSVGGGAATKPAGLDTQVQFNNNGAFGADANFTWSSTLKSLNVGNATNSARITGDFYSGNINPTSTVLPTRTIFQSPNGTSTITTTILTVMPPLNNSGSYASGGSYIQLFAGGTSNSVFLTLGVSGQNSTNNPQLNISSLNNGTFTAAQNMSFAFQNVIAAQYNLRNWYFNCSLNYLPVTDFVSVTGNPLYIISTGGGDYYFRVNANAAAGTLRLPTTANNAIPGRVYVIKKIDTTTNPVTIQPTLSTQLIDGAANLILTQPNSSVTLIVNGSNWEIISLTGGGAVLGSASAQKIITVAANYNILLTDSTIICNTNTASFSVTLPAAASAYNASTQIGQIFIIKNFTTGTVKNLTIVGTVDNATNPILSSNGSVMRVQSNGSTYYVV
jgi:hypothetical protein